jgi:Trk K+ transport system NAD-binding subunit
MPVAGHVIVCGLDHLGLRTVDELRLRDETVVAVGRTDDAEEHLTSLAVRLVVGDHRVPRVLREAGVEQAAVIVLTGDDDLGNLNTALAASELNPAIRVVIRMFDQELGSHIPDLFANGVALSSSALAAPGFVSAAIDGETGSRFALAGRLISTRRSGETPGGSRSIAIGRLHPDRTVEILPEADATAPDLILIDIAEASDPAALLDDAQATRAAASTRGPIARAVAAVRNRLSTPERRLVRFAAVLGGLALASALFFDVVAGLTPLDAISYAVTLLTGASLPAQIDSASTNAALRIYAIFLSLVGAAIVAVVYAFITDAIIRSRLLQTLGRRSVPRNIHDHVIVAGLGSIGYRVALGLQARGVSVVAVEVTDEGRFVSPTRAAGIPVFIGDARHREVLEELRLGQARALVATTSDDLVNLSTALNARAMRPDLRVVVRLFDPEFAVRVQHGFGIRFTRSASHLAAPAFAAAAMGSEVVATVPVGDRRVVLFARLRVPAGSALEGRRAWSLDAPGALRLLAVADPGSEAARWDVPDDEILDAGEEVVVAATRAGLGELLHLAATSDDARAAADAHEEPGGLIAELDHHIVAVAEAATAVVGTITGVAVEAATAASSAIEAGAGAASTAAHQLGAAGSKAASAILGVVAATGDAIAGGGKASDPPGDPGSAPEVEPDVALKAEAPTQDQR